MKKSLILISILLVALAVSAAAFACGAKGHCGAMQGVKHEIANTADGVTIAFTADKAENVKAIQEKMAVCGKGEMAHKGCICTMEGVKRTVTNTDTGVVVTLSGDKPETVKAIQDKAGACMKGDKKSCSKSVTVKEETKGCTKPCATPCSKKATT